MAGRSNTTEGSTETPPVAPSVLVHYVGGSQVREFSPADLRRVDPEYAGSKHVRFDGDNNFTVTAEDMSLTEPVKAYLTEDGEFAFSDEGEPSPQVLVQLSDKVLRHQSLSQPR